MGNRTWHTTGHMDLMNAYSRPLTTPCICICKYVPYLKCPSPLFHLVNPYSFKTPAKMSLLPLFLETSHGVFPIQSWFPLLSQPFITRLQNLSHSIALHFYETLPVNCELLEDWVLDSRGLSWGALLVPMGDLVHKAGWRLAGPWPCSASWVKGWCPQCPQVPYAGNTVWKVIQTPLLVKTT